MTHISERHLRTGGDPRTFADYVLLRDELNKLAHPARPDVNWHYAEKLCLSLFEHNGIELQTAAWYTLARTQIAGLTGLNEGLSILEALITRQWGSLWPQPVHARIEILFSLNKRLQQLLRTMTLIYADLGALYQAEKHLATVGEALQRLELRHQAGLDVLRQLLHTAAVRLENSDAGTAASPPVVLAPTAVMPGENAQAEAPRWVYVVQPAPEPRINVAPARPVKPWKPFAAGVLVTLIVGATALWGAHRQAENPVQKVLMATVAPLPAALPDDALKAMQQTAPGFDPVWLAQAQRQLELLPTLSPAWLWDYGSELVHQAQRLWPNQPETAALTRQWQQQLAVAAALPASLDGWHQGMVQLQQLAHRLNGLDEKKGKYMTVSELKSQVFSITQALNRTVPAEEQLRQLAAQPANSPASAALRAQTELHLKQLMAGFTLQAQEVQQSAPLP